MATKRVTQNAVGLLIALSAMSIMACGSKVPDDVKICVPKEFVDDESMCLNAPFSEVTKNKDVYSSEIDNSYAISLKSEYFDRINYDVSGDRITSFALLSPYSRIDSSDLQFIIAICGKTYGNQPLVEINKNESDSTVTLLWKAEQGYGVGLICTYKIPIKHTNHPMIFSVLLYGGKVEEMK